MRPPTSRSSSLVRCCGLFLALALLVGAAHAASTGVRVVKLAADGKTVIDERSVDYRWLEANLPVRGDGSTHYYHQGPTFDDADLWDPSESKNVEDKDMGAVKGTAMRDLCGLVGGMQSGDTLVVRASDGFSKRFSYRTVYSPSARQGQMVLAWYRADEGYVPSFSTGMRLVFFADTSVNPWGWHVFGNADMKASMPSSEWHYFNGVYPTTTGLSVQSVNEVRILSTQSATTVATTTATTLPTTAPRTTAAVTTPVQTAKPTVTATAPVTTAPVPTVSVPASATVTVAPAQPTATVVPTGATQTVPPTGGESTSVATTVATTLPAGGDGIVVTSLVTTAPPSDGTDPGPVDTTAVVTTVGATATVSALPSATDAVTAVPSPAPNETANVTPIPTGVPVTTVTGYDRTRDYSISTGIDYEVEPDIAGTVTTTPTPTESPIATPSPEVSPGATVVVTTAPSLPAAAPSPTVTAEPTVQGATRSLKFTLSFQVRESGTGPAASISGPRVTGVVSPLSPLGTLWAFLKAIARLIDPFFI